MIEARDQLPGYVEYALEECGFRDNGQSLKSVYHVICLRCDIETFWAYYMPELVYGYCEEMAIHEIEGNFSGFQGC